MSELESQGEATSAESTSSAPESTAVETSSTQEASSTAETTSNSADVLAVPQYIPNFKFKVKGKDAEIDEFLRPVIKDKATEDKLRDLYEKAHGLEEVKAHRQSLQEKYRTAEEKMQQVETSLKTLGDFAKKKDFRTFFDILSIPKQDIINYALEELKYSELPPDQRAMVDAQRQREIEYYTKTQQNQTLQQQMQNLILQQTTMELNQELARPDIAQTINAYDARVGQPGALRAEIIRRGQYYEAVHKQSPPASQLVAEVFNLIGSNTSVTPNGMFASQGNMGPQSQNPQQKPVIPSFSSGGAAKSPVRKQPKDLDDLRKMRQQLHQT